MPATPTEPATIYVAVWNDRPIGVSGHLGDALAAAVAREFQYATEKPEHRWDPHPGGGYWDLMILNAKTKRWNRTTTETEITLTVDLPGIGRVEAVTDWYEGYTAIDGGRALPLMRALETTAV